jgi:hypothetical protein
MSVVCVSTYFLKIFSCKNTFKSLADHAKTGHSRKSWLRKLELDYLQYIIVERNATIHVVIIESHQ